MIKVGESMYFIQHGFLLRGIVTEIAIYQPLHFPMAYKIDGLWVSRNHIQERALGVAV